MCVCEYHGLQMVFENTEILMEEIFKSEIKMKAWEERVKRGRKKGGL